MMVHGMRATEGAFAVKVMPDLCMNSLLMCVFVQMMSVLVASRGGADRPHRPLCDTVATEVAAASKAVMILRPLWQASGCRFVRW